jgi:putative membrane protein
MDIDLILAIAHHLTVFSLVGVFAAEFALIRPGLAGARIAQLARIDLGYGALSGVVILVGVLRVFLGSSGWQYYAANHMFWGKMLAFLIMGLLTIRPTMAIRRWVGQVNKDPGFAPSASEIAYNRRYVHMQAGMLVLIPSFAAAMARGYGVA